MKIQRDILLFYILPKLPIKSLFRLQCVCKEWYDLITTNRAFIREQSRSSMTFPSIAYMGHDGLHFLAGCETQIGVLDPSLKFMEGSMRLILSSCNGLLCFLVCPWIANWTIFVGNPVTNEWSLIPSIKKKLFCGLAFDPLDSPQSYKLVSFYPRSIKADINNCVELEFHVFSSDTGVWMQSGEIVVITYNEWRSHSHSLSVFAGGILYWKSLIQFIWFDTKRNRAGVFLQPSNDVLKNQDNYVLGVSEDRLMYTTIMDNKIVDVWIMGEFKWTRMYQVSLDSVIQAMERNLLTPRKRWNEFKLLQQGGDFLYFAIRDGTGVKVIYYNMKMEEVMREVNTTLKCQDFFPYNKSMIRLPKLSKHVS